MIDWATLNTTKEDLRIIGQLAARAIELGVPRAQMDLVMDLELAHSETPLRLRDMEGAQPSDLIHDVAGIVRHLDRETGELRDCFLPRYAV